MTSLIQNGYYKLTKHLFLLSLKRILPLCAGLCVLTLILLRSSVTMASFIKAYESLIFIAGIRYLFLAFVVLLIIFETAAIYVECFRNGGIYTVMMLPTQRRNVYLAYCTRGIVCMLLLWTVQTVTLLAAYGPIMAACKDTAATFALWQNTAQLPGIMRTNGLFLAVIRSDLFHILLPQSLPEAINSLLVLLGLGSLPSYMLAGVLRRINLQQGLLMVCTAACVLWAFICRFSTGVDIDITAFFVSTVLTLLLITVSTIDGIRRLNKDAGLV